MLLIYFFLECWSWCGLVVTACYFTRALFKMLTGLSASPNCHDLLSIVCSCLPAIPYTGKHILLCVIGVILPGPRRFSTRSSRQDQTRPPPPPDLRTFSPCPTPRQHPIQTPLHHPAPWYTSLCNRPLLHLPSPLPQTQIHRQEPLMGAACWVFLSISVIVGLSETD